MKTWFLFPMLLSLLVLGCTEDSKIANPTEPGQFRIAISALPDRIAAPEGFTRSVPFVVEVTDESGRPAAGEQATLTLLSSPGEISPYQATTDNHGMVDALYSVTLPTGVTRARIAASVGADQATAMVTLTGYPPPTRLYLHTDTPQVTVVENQSAEIVLTAALTDAQGNGVPGVELGFELISYPPAETIFGSLDHSPPTDQNGETRVMFKSQGGHGKQGVVCSLLMPDSSVLHSLQMIEVKSLTGTIASLTSNADPDNLYLESDELGRSVVKARVLDTSRRAIPNLEVKFSVDKGSLGNPSLTDEAGIARVEYYIQPLIDLMPDTRDTVATVHSEIVGTEFQADAQISIRTTSREIGSITIFGQKTEIYADGDVTADTIYFVMKDADYQVMGGETIFLICDYPGIILSPIITDSSGVATTVFNDIGLPSLDENGNPVPVTITARYPPWNWVVSWDVTILKRSPVTSISLIVGANQLIAGRGDSTSVQATCIQLNGRRAADGTLVNFRCEGIPGRFTRDRAYIQSGNGQVETEFITPNKSGTALLSAFVVNEQGDSAISNIVPITVLPGPPSRVEVSADPDTLVTNDPNAYSTITATVTDTFGNPVTAGTQVWFRTSLGIISGSSITDTLGKAFARLTPGVTAGIAEVTALVRIGAADSISGFTSVTFVAGSASRISLGIDTTKIQVRGTGGLESARLFAWVYDALGNLISAPVPVIFELIRPPEETNINNHGISDSTITSGGLAVATVNSGTECGIVMVRATTWEDPETRLQPVWVIASICQVVSGWPDVLDLDISDDAQDMGGGAWGLEIEGRVYDRYRNPIGWDFPVSFTVEPGVATIEPSQIEDGTLKTMLIYNSSNSFDILTIIASIQLPDTVKSFRFPCVLPLQQGTLQLNVYPTNWMFDRNTPNELCLIRIWAVLQDGHGVLINNGPVLFTAARGTLSWADYRGAYHEYEPPDPAIKYTEDGTATVYLRGIMDDFFLDAFSLERTVQLDAGVVGYDDVNADPGFVFMTRH